MYFLCTSSNSKGAQINFNGSSAELMTPSGTFFLIKQQGCLYNFKKNFLLIFLKEKSDAVNPTKRFLADIVPNGNIKTLSSYDDVFPSGKVKHVHSDKGREYLSKEFSGPSYSKYY